MTDLEQVTHNGFYIRNIENPSEELQLAAVNFNPMAIKYIKSPTEKVCLEAVSHNGKTLKYVRNQTVELCKAAVKEDRRALYYVKKECLTEEFYRYALKVSGEWQSVICDFMPYEYCEKIWKEMWEEETDDYFKSKIERDLKRKKLYGKKNETAMAMLGSVIEDILIDGVRKDSNIFYAHIPSWGRVYLIGFEQLESKIEAKVVGVAEMCAYEYAFDPALILCPVDKTFSKKEILNMLRHRRAELKGIYIDNTIAK